VHYRGETTEGKTTALYVAGSVWGGGSDKGFLKRWKTTGNGLENVSACHNDSLLCLDEIAECDPREVGAIAYMLANGQGKIRSHRGYATRPVIEWRLLFLSSGEIRLSDLMAQNGQRIKGGQEVRFVNIESNAGAGYGLFEDLHGFKGGAAFSKYLVECSKRYYGTAIRSFIKSLVGGQALIKREARNFLKNFIASNVPADAGSEVGRVANRFGLAAYAGEYATAQGITGWSEGAAEAAAAQLFREWIEARGTIGSSEAELAIKQVRAFLEAHGSSRFQTRDDQVVVNRAGFRVTNKEGEIEYLIQPEQFGREICAGFDPEFVARTLHNRGCLTRPPAQIKGYTCARRVPDQGRKHVYVINSRIFGAEEGTNQSDE
jgi:putative DNA primase/helicase